MYKFDLNKFRSFNLVPPKSKQELLVYEERDNTFLYSLVLIIFSFVFFISLTFINEFFLINRIRENDSKVETIEFEIETFSSIRRKFGELIIKSQLLQPIVTQDIKIIELLNIGDQLVKNLQGVTIRSYSRNEAGDFIMTIEFSSIESIKSIFANASNVENITDIFVNSFSRSQNFNNFVGSVTFRLSQ